MRCLLLLLSVLCMFFLDSESFFNFVIVPKINVVWNHHTYRNSTVEVSGNVEICTYIFCNIKKKQGPEKLIIESVKHRSCQVTKHTLCFLHLSCNVESMDL